MWRDIDVISEKEGVTLQRHHKVAILASAFYESSWDPKAVNKLNDGKNDDPTGHFQIKPKSNNLEGVDLTNPFSNLEAILTKVYNGKDYGGAFKDSEFLNATTVKEATWAFSKNIERMKDKSNSKKRERTNLAEQIFKKLSKQQVREPEKLNENLNDNQVYTKNVLKRIQKTNKGNVLQFRKSVKALIKDPVRPIDIESMIGTPKSPNSELIEILLSIDAPRYSNILNGTGDPYTKALNILNKHNTVASTDSTLMQAKENNRIDEIAHKNNKTMPIKLNKKRTYTFKGVTITIPPMISTEKIQQDVEGQLNNQNTADDKDKKAGQGHQALFQLYRWASYLDSLNNQQENSVQYKALANALVEENKFMLGALIRTSATAKPYRNRATWLLKKEDLKSLTNEPSLKLAITNAAGLRASTIEKFYEENKIAYSLEKTSIGGRMTSVYVPKGKALSPEDKAKPSLTSTPLTLPDENNNQTSENISFGPNGSRSSLVAALSPNSKIKGGTNTSPEDVKKLNEKLQNVKERIITGVEHKDTENGLTHSQQIINFLNGATEDINLKDIHELYTPKLIDALAYSKFYKIIDGSQKSFTEIEATSGKPVEGKYLPTQFARRTTDKELNLVAAYKEAKAITPFMTSASATAESIILNFEDVGVLTLKGDMAKGHYSPKVREIYTRTMNLLHEDARTVADLRGYVEKNLLSSKDPKEREEGTLMMMALQRSGASRSSSMAAGFDSLLTKFGSIKAILSSVQGGSNTAVKLLNSFFGSEKEEMDKAKNAYVGQFGSKGAVIQRGVVLEKAKKDAETRLTKVLNDANASTDMKKLAIFTARRTFDAITLTYQFAGMIQGGSGGRAISNEDFENMWKALWGGDGVIQASNIRHVKGIIDDISQRVKIINALAHRGSQVVDQVLDYVIPIQRGYRAWKQRQDTQRDSVLLGSSDIAMTALFGDKKVRTADQVSSWMHLTDDIYKKASTKNYTMEDTSEDVDLQGFDDSRMTVDGSNKISLFDLVDPQKIKDVTKGSPVRLLQHLQGIPVGMNLNEARTGQPKTEGHMFEFGQTQTSNGIKTDRNITNLDGYLYSLFLHDAAITDADLSPEIESMIPNQANLKMTLSHLADLEHVPAIRKVLRLVYGSNIRTMMRRYLSEKGGE